MNEPLAQRLRPQSLQEVCGQQHLLAKGRVLRSVLESGKIPNMIFYGPSGVGKTTVARIIADNSGMRLHKLNGTSAGTADIKNVISEIGTMQGAGGILLYLDEIQYLNKKQQQSLLECIEDGSITLIASTTENPYFYVYNALLSRSTVFEFKPLCAQDVQQGLTRAIEKIEKLDGVSVDMPADALAHLATACGGDMRKSLNCLELVISAAPVINKKKAVTLDMAKEVAQRSSMRYDRDADMHYDVLSGLQKSIRGSDANAAVHYLARLLIGDDLISACRRLLVIACEDIGLAYPQAVTITKACVDSALQLGLPEARIPLAQAAIMLATAPKSNSAICAIDAAMADLRAGRSGDIPAGIQDAHYSGAAKMGRGLTYQYPHNFAGHWVQQQYLPDIIKDAQYYTYGDNKTEQAAKAYWDKIKGL
ncbi:MAG: replication-associated recombination protein A [Oscillospiraceae bacterium]|nr:replication-associated recombination protein A [Oscillospiraceae bacterium]